MIENFNGRLDLTMEQAREKWSFKLLPSGNYKIIAFNKPDTEIIIPSSINGIPVEKLEDKLFEKRRRIKTIYISEGITDIGERTFFHCRNLKEVYFPSTLKEIKPYTFYQCRNLETFKAITTSNIEIIRDYAFCECNSLKQFDISPAIKDIETGAISGCYNLKLNKYDNAYYLGNNENPYFILKRTAYDNEKTVEQISKNVDDFYNDNFDLSDVEKVEISPGIFINRDIHEAKHIKLCEDKTTSCKIHPDTKIIFNDVFAYCLNLKEITIPKGVKLIKNDAFKNCEKLEKVNFENKENVVIEKNAFIFCYKLKF